MRMTSMELEGCGHVIIKVYPGSCLDVRGRPYKSSLRISGDPVEL
jgi:hypothetical protein